MVNYTSEVLQGVITTEVYGGLKGQIRILAEYVEVDAEETIPTETVITYTVIKDDNL